MGLFYYFILCGEKGPLQPFSFYRSFLLKSFATTFVLASASYFLLGVRQPTDLLQYILSSRSVIYSNSSQLRLSRLVVSIFSLSFRCILELLMLLLRTVYKQQILFLNVFQTHGRLSCYCFQGQNRRSRAFETCYFKINT